MLTYITIYIFYIKLTQLLLIFRFYLIIKQRGYIMGIDGPEKTDSISNQQRIPYYRNGKLSQEDIIIFDKNGYVVEKTTTSYDKNSQITSVINSHFNHSELESREITFYKPQMVLNPIHNFNDFKNGLFITKNLPYKTVENEYNVLHPNNYSMTEYSGNKTYSYQQVMDNGYLETAVSSTGNPETTTRFYDEGKTTLVKDDKNTTLNYFNKRNELLRSDKIAFKNMDTATDPDVAIMFNQTTTDYKNNTKYSIPLFDTNKNKNIQELNTEFYAISGEKVTKKFNSDLKKGESHSKLEIKDKDGNTLFYLSRMYSKVSDTEAVSFLNGQRYDMKFEDEKVTVTYKGEKTEINLKKLVNPFTKNREELKEMVKQLPGDILLQLGRETKIMNYEEGNGEFRVACDGVDTDLYMDVLIHELGHAIDLGGDRKYCANGHIRNYNITGRISDNKEFLKIFNEEKAQFLKMSPVQIQEYEDYLTSKPSEMVAEGYAIINQGSTVKIQNEVFHETQKNRQLLMLQFFPKTISYIGNKMTEYKQIYDPSNPRSIREYYGDL